MTRPRITVITPSLNQCPFIEQSICSVLDQGYEDLEYLVIDGGSTDGTLGILRHYADQITWWASAADGGPAEAINKALARATGDIIVVVNGDDLLMPGALDAAADAMTGPLPDRARWVVGDCLRIGGEDQMLGRLHASGPSSLQTFLMHDSGLLPAAATFLAADLLRSLGPMEERMQFAYGYEYACRLLAAGERPRVLHRVLAAQREYDGSRTAANAVQQGLEFIAAARRYGDQLPLAQRVALWRNCDARERIYTLAEAEARGRQARGYLLRRVMRRPWWVANDSLRNALLHGTRPLPSVWSHPAA